MDRGNEPLTYNQEGGTVKNIGYLMMITAVLTLGLGLGYWYEHRDKREFPYLLLVATVCLYSMGALRVEYTMTRLEWLYLYLADGPWAKERWRGFATLAGVSCTLIVTLVSAVTFDALSWCTKRLLPHWKWHKAL